MEPAVYLQTVIIPMLKHPHCFNVVQTQDQMGVLLTMDIHKEDMGIIVGKKGETAKSIRNLVRIVGIIGGARVSVKINEPKT